MIFYFKPIFLDKIWGGNKLKTLFGYDSSDQCGEVWGISAYKDLQSVVINGPFKGRTLKDLYDNEKQLFGNPKQLEFPILVKIIDAAKDLSVQVHPGDDYAAKYNSYGKNECWYVLATDNDTKMIIGHKAKTKDELNQLIDNLEFDKLLNKFSIKKDEYFYIKEGTIHAICAGTVLLEVQQSSDLTFRLYDYNRLENNSLRPLHLNEAKAVINVPDNKILTKHDNTYFDYDIKTITGTFNKTAHVHGDYIAVIEGSGLINDLPLKKGDFLMVSSNDTYDILGNLKIQITNF